MEYGDFLEKKRIRCSSSGLDAGESISRQLFEWQRDIVRWALKKGRAAMFEDCGLGKTPQQLEYARQVCERESANAIIFYPLCVLGQAVAEGQKFGIPVTIIENQADIKKGINITNYEKMGRFDFRSFGCVVLDESSILKHTAGSTRQELTRRFRHTPYKLCCTATPAPNDFMEMGNHAEFLGVMTQGEMLSSFFIHDGGDTAKWRLKGHAEDKFWEWIASWACVMKTPDDLGYDASDYILPELHVHEHVVKSSSLESPDGQTLLLPQICQTLNDRRTARRGSLSERVSKASEIANGTDEQVLVWCDLNDESAALAKAINGATEVRGSDTDSHKADAMSRFASGEIRAMVSKPSIAGWGMNWQHCHKMIFVGLSDSFEAYYQALRRCWRFGQKQEVHAHIVISDGEGAVRANILRKQRDMDRMIGEMVKRTQKILAHDIRHTERTVDTYAAGEPIALPKWIGGSGNDMYGAETYRQVRAV